MNRTGNISIRKKTRTERIAQEKVAKKASYIQGTTAKGESGEEIPYREQRRKWQRKNHKGSISTRRKRLGKKGSHKEQQH